VKELPKYFPADKVLLGVSEFLDSAGVRGMVGGQVLDIKGSGREDGDYLKLMHAGKTGSLIISSLTIPALLGGATPSEIQIIRDYGDKLGLLFQVVDDILDVTQTKETLGKTPNKDIEQKKLTFVTLWGLEKATQIAKDLSQEADDLIAPLSKRHTFLRDIIPYLLTRES
jgi:geranylgeranyl diphosphate synthase type II